MLTYEKEKLKEGYKLIAGMDEAGRGPLAGAVFTAICIMPLDEDKIISGVNDSKQLSYDKREELFEKIKQTAIAYEIVPISETEIDKINILEATKLGMKKSVDEIKIKPDYCLVDYVPKLNLNIPFETIVKGDSKSYSIACASILAKVARDKYMENLAKDFPNYAFEKHKGYPTKLHYELISKYGISPVHRKSFLKNINKHIG